MTTKTYTTTQVEIIGDSIITEDSPVAQALLELDADHIKWHRLRRGDIVCFRLIEVTAEIEEVPEYRYGWSGQLREQVTSKSEKIISEDTRKLWHTKVRGWYWLEG